MPYVVLTILGNFWEKYFSIYSLIFIFEENQMADYQCVSSYWMLKLIET